MYSGGRQLFFGFGFQGGIVVRGAVLSPLVQWDPVGPRSACATVSATNSYVHWKSEEILPVTHSSVRVKLMA